MRQIINRLEKRLGKKNVQILIAILAVSYTHLTLPTNLWV